MSVVGQAVALLGSLLMVVAAVGVLRLPGPLARMHALTKASTLGFVLVALGVVALLETANDRTTVLLAAAVQALTMPVAATLMGRSIYLVEGPGRLDSPDELDAARRAAEARLDRTDDPDDAAGRGPAGPDGDRP